MKTVLLVLALFTAFPALAAIECSSSTINNVYIPKFREVAEWDPNALRPYAQKLCELERQREALQTQVRDLASKSRENSFRICNDLDDDAQGRITNRCVKAHGEKINNLIDQCREVMALGHNAHNVGIPLDEITIENACLRGTAISLKNANGL